MGVGQGESECLSRRKTRLRSLCCDGLKINRFGVAEIVVVMAGVSHGRRSEVENTQCIRQELKECMIVSI